MRVQLAGTHVRQAPGAASLTLVIVAVVLFLYATFWFGSYLKLDGSQWVAAILLLLLTWVGSVIYMLTRVSRWVGRTGRLGMGCCLLALISSFAPRIALLLVWIFTSQVTTAFHHTFIWPFLGLLFLPFTDDVLCAGVSTRPRYQRMGICFVVIGFFLDLSSYGGGGYSRRR